VGYLGQAPASLSGLRGTVSVAEIEFDAVTAGARLFVPYREFNRQPPVERDLSLVLKDEVSWASIERTVRQSAPATLESIRFLSEYRGKGIDPGHKGWAFSMLYRAADRTLTGPEVDQAVQGVLRALEASFGARQR
jgi:phenylalanyl-tRNA synthetase beta chain